jgi:hypothetical protein
MAQIDQEARRRQPEIQQRHQALAAGDRLGAGIGRQQGHRLGEDGGGAIIEGRRLHRLLDQFQRSTPHAVIPGRRAAANPEAIFQRPVFMGSGPGPAGRPGMTAPGSGGQAFDPATYVGGATERRPATPWRSIRLAISPFFFDSSTKSRRKENAAVFFFGVPIACCTAVN